MLWWSNRAFIAHLEAEIAWLRDQRDHERQRAEEAINAMLAVRLLPSSLATHTAEEVRRAQSPTDPEVLLRNTEFMDAGA